MVKYHYTRDIYEKKQICLEYISTNEMAADILTKNLMKQKHWRMVKLMGLHGGLLQD